jgi:hypothetical protein
VTWTHLSRNGGRGSATLSAWDGPVVEIDGDRVIIKRRGKRYRVKADRVRRAGERNELTDIVHAMATPIVKPWNSGAQWPDGTVSKDGHDTEEAAKAVCSRLEREGWGGEGRVLPIRTWVECVKDGARCVWAHVDPRAQPHFWKAGCNRVVYSITTMPKFCPVCGNPVEVKPT